MHTRGSIQICFLFLHLYPVLFLVLSGAVKPKTIVHNINYKVKMYLIYQKYRVLFNVALHWIIITGALMFKQHCNGVAGQVQPNSIYFAYMCRSLIHRNKYIYYIIYKLHVLYVSKVTCYLHCL